MSIVDSQLEMLEAKARLSVADDDQLIRDLAYWATTAQDHRHEFHEINERRAAVQQQFVECEAWIALVGDEMRDRKARAREALAAREPTT